MGVAALLFILASALAPVPSCEAFLAGGGGTRTRRASSSSSLAMRRSPLQMPSSEPLVPYKEIGMDYSTWMSVTESLQRNRIVIIKKFIDDQYANSLIAMLIYLEKESPTKPVSLYFNCPGAALRPAMALYDTIQHLAFPTATVNIGLATGMISFLVAAGSKGSRAALPNARFLMQKTGMEDVYRGQASSVHIEVAHLARMNHRMEEELAKSTGQPLEKIRKELKRDFYLSAAEAVQYGVIDRVLLPKEAKRLSSGAGFGTFGGEAQRYGSVTGSGYGRGPQQLDTDMPSPDIAV
jgi:ATP-dependent Clp protease protease subunit